MKRISKNILAVVFGIFLSLPAVAQEATAQGEFSLQGRLTTGVSNEAIVDGTYDLTITVYDAATGNVVATETDQVTTLDGIFSTMVGDNSTLELSADSDYEIGISVDGGSELAPHIMLGSAPNAVTADIAANANAVGGFTASSSGGANTIVVTNTDGRIDAGLLSNSMNVTGNGVSVSTEGGTLNLDITGGAGGDFDLPFTGSATVGKGESAFKITSMGAGSAAAFLNTGAGAALDLTASSGNSAALDISNSAGAAVEATGSMASGAVLNIQNMATDATAGLIAALNANGETALEVMGNGQTTIKATAGTALDLSTSAANDAAIRLKNSATDATASLIAGLNAEGDMAFRVKGNGQTMINTAGEAALDLTTDASSNAVISLQNLSTDATAKLISAVNPVGNAAFEVMGNGHTTINSTVGDALEVSTSAAGEAALNVVGGLTLTGPVGTATLPAGNTSIEISNALVNANSVILITVNSATNLANGLRLSGQGDGQFTVSLLDAALGALSGDVKFNYLIINNGAAQ